MKQLKSKLKEYRVLSICVVFLAIFVALACLSGAWPSSDFAAQILAALAGAIVAAIITLFLLQGQTESEAKKDKDSKVFEEKLNIYQGFLRKLCAVIEDKKITPEEDIQLQFEVAQLSIHTKNENLAKISKAVGLIGTWVGKGNSSDNSNDFLLANLMTIVECLREELYSSEEISGFGNPQQLRDMIGNFRIFGDISENKNETEEIVQPLESEWTGAAKFAGWSVATSNGTEIKLTKDNYHFSVGVSIENNQWYFWVSTDLSEDARNIYQYLKSKFGGRFSQYSCWWKNLKDEYIAMPVSEFIKNLNADSEFESYIVDTLSDLCEYTLHLQTIYDEIYNQLCTQHISNNGGYTWLWYDRTLVIDFGENANRPFMDIILNDNGTYCITIARRNDAKIELLNSDIVNKIGLTLATDGRYKIDQLSKTDVVEYVNLINENIHNIINF